MKALLVIDMPKTCGECPLCYKEEMFQYRCKVSEDKVVFKERYENCPLKPLPEKKGNTIYKVVGTYEDGYDACIDDIRR